MDEKIKVGDSIQGFGGFTHSNGDMLHTDVDETIKHLNQGCYVGDVDLAPNIDEYRQLSKEDLEQITIEVNDNVYDEFGEPVIKEDIEEGD